MGQLISINPGEVRIRFTSPPSGKLTFADLGLKDDQLKLDNGHLRIVIELNGIPEKFYHVPTIEIAYNEEVAETRWIAEFNSETIIDKTDNHGRSSVILMDRKKLREQEHRHYNKLVIHGIFPKKVSLVAKDCYLNLFK